MPEQRLPATPGRRGRVILVGAGPGDPELLTLAGRRAIEQADVILHDRLIGDEILAMSPPGAEIIDVGKARGNHPVPQDEINRLLVRHALEGKTVVRLKGGDPYLFGRGAEELEQVAGAGIPFRVVPGVSSAIAVPALAGIPATHRDHASSLHIITGHGKDGSPHAIPYRELAGTGGTLAFLMAVAAIGEICRNLVAAGMAEETPAALIENGASADQRRISGTLATLPERALSERVASPAVLIVGSVCALAATLDWTARLPLRGKRILVVGSRLTGGRLAALLRDDGCAVDAFAGIRTEALPAPDGLWRAAGGYDWIVFTSEAGTDYFFAGFFGNGGDVRTLAAARFAVVGPRTGLALARHGIRADFMPDEFGGPALGAGLARLVSPGERVLLFRAEAGGGELPAALRERGAAVDDVAAYRTAGNTMEALLRDRLLAGRYDAATFTSASAVEAFAEAAPPGLAGTPPAFCIGPATAEAARRRGMRVAVAPEASIEAMAAMIVAHMGET